MRVTVLYDFSSEIQNELSIIGKVENSSMFCRLIA